MAESPNPVEVQPDPRAVHLVDVIAKAAELPELVRQSTEYAAALGIAPLVLPGHDHFTILEELARPDGALCNALGSLAGGVLA